MEFVNNHLGQKLKELRGNLSLYEVEKDVGITRISIQRYESGERVPEDRNLEILAEYYQVPFELLKTLIFQNKYPSGSRDFSILKNYVNSEAENS